GEERRLRGVPVVEVVRRELVVPFQRASVGIQRQDRVRVEVVAFPLVAVVVGARVAGWPVEQPGFRIVGAREPGPRATVFERLASPRFGPRLAWCRDRPEPPYAFASGCFVGVEKSADAL